MKNKILAFILLLCVASLLFAASANADAGDYAADNDYGDYGDGGGGGDYDGDYDYGSSGSTSLSDLIIVVIVIAIFVVIALKKNSGSSSTSSSRYLKSNSPKVPVAGGIKLK